MRDFILRELDRVGLGHNTFTQPAIDLIVRSADGVLRKARNLCVGCLIEAVRSANKTIDIDNVNRVLMQPHWQKEADLTCTDFDFLIRRSLASERGRFERPTQILRRRRP